MKIKTKKTTGTIKIRVGEEVGEFKVEPLLADASAKLIQKHMPPKIWHGNEATERVPDYNSINLETIDKIIISWNVKDEEGNPVECTSENKKNAFLCNPDIFRKVIRMSEKLLETEAVEEELDKKN